MFSDRVSKGNFNAGANDTSQSGNVPPPLSLEQKSNAGFMRHFLAIVLSLCLALFLADAFASLADDSLILFFQLHLLAGIRSIVCFFAMLAAIVVYGLMALTPMIPKRWFLPLTLFYLVSQLALIPFLIYHPVPLQQVVWVFSCGQVLVGIGILYWIQSGSQFHWALVKKEQLVGRYFSWRNLTVFVFANVFVLLPATVLYLFLSVAVAVNHFSDGFMALHLNGFTVQMRKYVRADGKTIQLFPMAHIADAGFYLKVSQAFPTNSIILMEGVTDQKNLLTNGISYKRIAKFLGLAEQKVRFGHGQAKMVRADVDVDRFSKNTVDFLNMVMLLHSQGFNAENVMKLTRYSPSPDFEEQLIADLLTNRNKHLEEEIQSHLSETDQIMVPWGVAHMPGIANDIQKSGFRLVESRDYEVIRFHFPFRN
jgi:hypothetical protein